MSILMPPLPQIFRQLGAAKFFADPPSDVPTYAVDVYYVTMGAYWPPIYPLEYWWCHIPLYICTLCSFFNYLDVRYYRMSSYISLAMAGIGFYTVYTAILQCCTAITQALLVYESMLITANDVAIRVPADWVRGSRSLAVTAILSLFMLVTSAVVSILILWLPVLFQMPVKNNNKILMDSESSFYGGL